MSHASEAIVRVPPEAVAANGTGQSPPPLHRVLPQSRTPGMSRPICGLRAAMNMKAVTTAATTTA